MGHNNEATHNEQTTLCSMKIKSAAIKNKKNLKALHEVPKKH